MTANVQYNHWHSAFSGERQESIFGMISGEADDFGISWTGRLGSENVSAVDWYTPDGLSALESGTAAQTTTIRYSATATPDTTLRVSARILTSGSGRRLIEYFDLEIEDI